MPVGLLAVPQREWGVHNFIDCIIYRSTISVELHVTNSVWSRCSVRTLTKKYSYDYHHTTVPR